MNREDVLKIDSMIKRFSSNEDLLKDINSIIYDKKLQGNNLLSNELIIDTPTIDSCIHINDYFGEALSEVGIAICPIIDDELYVPIKFLPLGKGSNINLHIIYNTLLNYLKDKITISSKESREIVETIKFKKEGE